jgi:hypothetical protein
VGSTAGGVAAAAVGTAVAAAQGWTASYSGWRRRSRGGRQHSSQQKKRPKYLIIEVTDTGVGMDQVCIAHSSNGDIGYIVL